MRYYALPVFLLLVLSLIALACGSPAAPSGGLGTGILQSVSISPATADAQNYGGQVQFTATGYYTTPPYQVTPLKATWGTCYQENPTSEISVSSSGLAQCAAGAIGTYTVWAFAPSNEPACPALSGVCGTGGCQVTGTAQLTCP